MSRSVFPSMYVFVRFFTNVTVSPATLATLATSFSLPLSNSTRAPAYSAEAPRTFSFLGVAGLLAARSLLTAVPAGQLAPGSRGGAISRVLSVGGGPTAPGVTLLMVYACPLTRT